MAIEKNQPENKLMTSMKIWRYTYRSKYKNMSKILDM